MNTQEEWIYWDRMKDISGRYCIEAIYDKIDQGFSLLLMNNVDERKKINILFEKSVHAYRTTEEGLCLDTWHQLSKKYGTDFYAFKNFFKINHSSYIKSLSEKVCDVSGLMHFVIIDDECKFDIISSYEPKINFLGEELI